MHCTGNRHKGTHGEEQSADKAKPGAASDADPREANVSCRIICTLKTKNRPEGRLFCPFASLVELRRATSEEILRQQVRKHPSKNSQDEANEKIKGHGFTPFH